MIVFAGILIIVFYIVGYENIRKFVSEEILNEKANYNIKHKVNISLNNVTSKNREKELGDYGELLIYDKLKIFENDGGKVLRNIYIPKENAEATEIDLVLIYKSGIHIIASKNYSGWIFGSDNKKVWTQCLAQGRNKPIIKNHFLNPVYQNQGHINCLKKLLNDYAKGEFSERKKEELTKNNINFYENKLKKRVPMHSIIVFSERCELKEIKLSKKGTIILQRNDLLPTIININNKCFNSLNQNDIEWIYQVLYPYTRVSENFKRMHIENIKNKM